jgi:hypothetical protein
MNIKTEAVVSSKNNVPRIHVKKEEEEEEDRDNDDHNSNNNYDGTATATDTAGIKSRGFEQIKVKKEEEEKEDDGNNNNDNPAGINNCSSNRKNADDDDDNYYTDWTSGNWGWLLPTSNTTCSNDNTNANANANTNTNANTNANANNTAIPSATPSSSISSTSISRKRTTASRSRNMTSVIKKDTPKSKKTRLLPPPPPPPSNNRHATTVKLAQEEDSVCYNDEVNNKANDDNDDGYESWTEGNWCLILPTGSISSSSSSSSTHMVANIKYTRKQNRNWNEMFHRLISYKNQHNSMVVPRNDTADPKLGIWVQCQRNRRNPNSDHRVNLLNSVGFVWNTPDNQWDEMFQRLVAYKDQHNGSVSRPSRYEADIQLRKWVWTQRYYYNSNNKLISVHRIERLESIGFVWNATYAHVRDGKWMETYDRLVAYKKQHKSTQVPQTYTDENDGIHLGLWVKTQRNAYNEKRLLKERVELLNSINFAWKGKKGAR